VHAFYTGNDAHHKAGVQRRLEAGSKRQSNRQPRLVSCWSKMVLRDVDPESAAPIAVPCHVPNTHHTPPQHQMWTCVPDRVWVMGDEARSAQ
jgi:hypothetical protein